METTEAVRNIIAKAVNEEFGGKQINLCEHCGIPKSTLSGWITGSTRNINADGLNKLMLSKVCKEAFAPKEADLFENNVRPFEFDSAAKHIRKAMEESGMDPDIPSEVSAFESACGTYGISNILSGKVFPKRDTYEGIMKALGESPEDYDHLRRVFFMNKKRTQAPLPVDEDVIDGFTDNEKEAYIKEVSENENVCLSSTSVRVVADLPIEMSERMKLASGIMGLSQEDFVKRAVCEFIDRRSDALADYQEAVSRVNATIVALREFK